MRLVQELLDAFAQLRPDAFQRNCLQGLAPLLAARIVLANALLVCRQLRPVGATECPERAEVAREDLRHLLAHARHAERVDEAVELRAACAVDAALEIL